MQILVNNQAVNQQRANLLPITNRLNTESFLMHEYLVNAVVNYARHQVPFPMMQNNGRSMITGNALSLAEEVLNRKHLARDYLLLSIISSSSPALPSSIANDTYHNLLSSHPELLNMGAIDLINRFQQYNQDQRNKLDMEETHVRLYAEINRLLQRNNRPNREHL